MSDGSGSGNGSGDPRVFDNASRLGWQTEFKPWPSGMRCGVVFVSTGGVKMMRALRSFRRGEPLVPVHILFNTSSAVWERNVSSVNPEDFARQRDVHIRLASTSGYINGSFNNAVRWMRDLGYTHACLLHDDTVFSPLTRNALYLSEWLARLALEPDLRDASGLTLSSMEALVTPPPDDLGRWHRPPEFWDSRDLESESVWRRLLPDGRPALYFGSPGSEDGVSLGDWFVKYFVTERTTTLSRLGPCGFIIPIATWEAVGGFGESDGIFYDMEYPVVCAMRGLPPVRVVPNIPFLHIHCQSTQGDPAVGLWEHDMDSFKAKYGGRDPGTVIMEQPGRGGY